MSSQPESRILVIDDHSDIRSLLRASLQRHFLHIDEASDGVEALERLRQSRYSVVLLDLVMPRIDGAGVLDYLNELEVPARPIVLVVTGSEGQNSIAIDPKRVHGIIRKPFDPAEVAALVKACVDIRAGRAFETMCFASALATLLIGSDLL